MPTNGKPLGPGGSGKRRGFRRLAATIRPTPTMRAIAPASTVSKGRVMLGGNGCLVVIRWARERDKVSFVSGGLHDKEVSWVEIPKLRSEHAVVDCACRTARGAGAHRLSKPRCKPGDGNDIRPPNTATSGRFLIDKMRVQVQRKIH